METKTAKWALGLGAALAFTGCAAEGKKSAAEYQPYAGWYMERAGQGTFQPCGQSRQWRVSGSSELGAKARKFGLDDNSPVYVRLFGARTESGNDLVVLRVEQFGSTTPVRNCGMNGVVIPESSPAGE